MRLWPDGNTSLRPLQLPSRNPCGELANLDPRVFAEPLLFKLDRDIKKYLMFNDTTNRKQCWGRDRVAMVVLRECVRAAGRLQGLRRVAGKGGEPPKLVGITTNLPARFTHILRKPARTTQNSPQATREDMSQATTPE